MPCRRQRFTHLLTISNYFLYNQWSQIWNRRSVSHSQPACRCESGRERKRGTLPFFFPRHSCMRERLVPFPLILLASSLQCMRFQLFQVLDFRLSFIEAKLRNVFSRLRAKEARRRRQFQIYRICSYGNNTSFFDILINFSLE